MVFQALTTGRCIFIHDLRLQLSIGVHPWEREHRQVVLVSVCLEVADVDLREDVLSQTVSYEDVIGWIKGVVGGVHINLVETLAERIVEVCFRDSRVSVVQVRVSKPDIIPEAGSVGVELRRCRGRF